jgi:hypothetical protein
MEGGHVGIKINDQVGQNFQKKGLDKRSAIPYPIQYSCRYVGDSNK